jgi:Ala-tRNA(Pro) deacylase
LDELGVKYKNYEHQIVFSCNDAKWVDIPGKRVKSLLIRNKKSTNFYMVVLWDNVRLDTNIVREFFWDSKMSFVSEDDMIKKIWLKPWSVSPFALINNIEKDINLVIDKKLEKQIVWFHPLQNDNTIVLHMDDVLKYVDKLWFKTNFIDL